MMDRMSGWITIICGFGMILSSMILIVTIDQEIKQDWVFALHMICICIGIMLLCVGQIQLEIENPVDR